MSLTLTHDELRQLIIGLDLVINRLEITTADGQHDVAALREKLCVLACLWSEPRQLEIVLK